MKKIVLALVAAAAFAANASAAGQAAPVAVAQASPETAAAIKELLQAMNYRTLMKQSFEQMAKALPAMMQQEAEAGIKADARLTEAQRKERLAKMEAEMPKVAAALSTVFSDPSLIDDIEKEMIPLYSRFFSAEQMKQIAAFYRTPAGARALQVMPQLMPEAMAIGQRVAQPRIAKALEQVQDK